MPAIVIAIIALPVIAALLAAVTRMESSLRAVSAPRVEPTPRLDDPRTQPLNLPIGRPIEPRRVASVRTSTDRPAPR